MGALEKGQHAAEARLLGPLACAEHGSVGKLSHALAHIADLLALLEPYDGTQALWEEEEARGERRRRWWWWRRRRFSEVCRLGFRV